MAKQGTPPSADEIEVSLFGPGYGEAILLHIGNGDWVAVDSCSKAKQCVPLAYLELLGVKVESAVKAIVVSHWHDDHISGLFQLYERARAAELYYPAAFETEVFQKFSQAYMQGDATPFSSETSEIGRIFRLALAHNRDAVPTLFDKPILSPGGLCQAVALSPSSAAFSRFVASIAKLVPTIKQRRKRIGSLTHNDAAVVLQVKTPAGLVLLGSDLEEPPHYGWTTLLGKTKALQTPSNVFKVAHHGSKNGHHEELWKKHLTPDSLAILTPFCLGRHQLPRKSDVERISKLTRNAYSTARVVRPTIGKTGEVARALRHAKVTIRELEPPTGHIRLRSKNGAPWSIERFDGAIRLALAHSGLRPVATANKKKAKAKKRR